MKNFRIFALIIAITVIFTGCGASTEALDSKNEYFDGGFISQDSMAVSPEAPEMFPMEEESVAEDSIFEKNN